MIYLIQPS